MYRIVRKQFIRESIDVCWDFFCSPKNLEKITPNNLGFIIKTQLPDNMYQGLFIEYTVKPVFGIPMNWITEITHIKNMEYFVDEQRKGPYKIWHHEHHFKLVEGGIEMTDVVSYVLPFGILGKLAHVLFVKSALKKIFDYRHQKIEDIFNK